MVGYNPEVILAGRRINSQMAAHAAAKLVKAMARQDIDIRKARVLVMGLTFKENCPDVRNTKVIDMVISLREFGVDVVIHDPWVDAAVAKAEFGETLITAPAEGSFDAVVLAVPHAIFLTDEAISINQLLRPNGVLMDLKSMLPKELGAVSL